MFRQNIVSSLGRHLRPSTINRLTGTRHLARTSPLPRGHFHHPSVIHQLRAIQTSSPGGPFQRVHGPPPPSSLGAPRQARSFTRTRKWTRRLILLLATGSALWLADRQIYASGFARSLRTFGTGLLVALDYKVNFRAEPLPLIGSEGGIPELHRRSAERMFDLLRHNGGLYLKIGQAIAMQSAVLPPEFQRMFARMFDDAPSVDWHEVDKVIREDFGGRGVEEVFDVSWVWQEGKGVMERTARASASVAQVHWARLSDGREVAIKIQKPEIKKQIGWDLWAFKYVGLEDLNYPALNLRKLTMFAIES